MSMQNQAITHNHFTRHQLTKARVHKIREEICARTMVYDLEYDP